MDVILPGLSVRLRELRKEQKIKQTEMAALLQCTDRHYQRIEYGQINLPTLDLIFLADYFHVTTDYLLGRSDEREEKSAGPLGQGPRSGIT